MFRHFNILSLIILGGVAALSYWFLSLLNQEALPPIVGHEPDYHITDLIAREFDLNGQLYHYLYAHTMKHYPDDDSTELVQPKAIFFEAGQPLWKLTANQGLVTSNGQQVILKQNVIIQRQTTPPMTLSTTHLTVQPKQRSATTDAPVKIIHDNAIITATGLHALFQKRGQLHLLLNVRGSYAPH